MTCASCSSNIEKTVSKLNGVNSISVNLLTNSATVNYEEDVITIKTITSEINKLGFEATAPELKDNNSGIESNDNQLKKLIISIIFLIPLMYVSMGHMFGAPMPIFINDVSLSFTQFLLTIPIIFINFNYFIKGYKSLYRLKPNMDSLIAIGSTAAIIYGIYGIFMIQYGYYINDLEVVKHFNHDLYFESAGTILVLITLGKYIENKSKNKTTKALKNLIDMSPKTALIEIDGKEVTIPIEQVKVGDILLVKPGAQVPVDGVVTEGETTIDQAAITGESLPVYKQKDDSVIGATINIGCFIKIRTSKVGEDSTFAQIIKLVEEASSSKAPISKLADKISGIFVPIVILIALITAIVWIFVDANNALSMSITVLIISCPCALGLATPLAIMMGTGKGAEHGLLIKSGEVLEITHHVDTIVLDKTGTITNGKPIVTDIIPINCNNFLSIVYSIEHKSEHPLSKAIIEYSKVNSAALLDVEKFQNHPGKGVFAKINNISYYGGNSKYMLENNINIDEIKDKIDSLSNEGKTPMIFANEQKVIGIVAVADSVKSSSKEAIEELIKLGKDVIMLTGDNHVTAMGIANSVGIKNVVADVLPSDKEFLVRRYQEQGRKVMMVGDGINDSPALVRSDVGVAIGNGSDIAIDSADIILMNNDLMSVVNMIKLSKSVINNIKQNLFWAFFYNALCIPIAAGVFFIPFGIKLDPMYGAIAMSVSSLFVVFNALKLGLINYNKKV